MKIRRALLTGLLAIGIYSCGDDGSAADAATTDAVESIDAVDVQAQIGRNDIQVNLDSLLNDVNGSTGDVLTTGADYLQQGADYLSLEADSILSDADADITEGGEQTGCTRSANISGAEVVHYPVEGETCEEAGESIFSGKEHAGETVCELAASYTISLETSTGTGPDPAKRCCCTASIDQVTNETKATVYMPGWNGCDTCFDEFYQNLAVHEQVHVDYCNDAGVKLVESLQSLPSEIRCAEDFDQACDLAHQALVDGADAAQADVLNEMEDFNEQYDSDTNHGETQGAVLNCDC